MPIIGGNDAAEHPVVGGSGANGGGGNGSPRGRGGAAGRGSRGRPPLRR